MCIVLGCTIFLFLYGSIWYMVFLFFFFWLFNYYLYFCRFIFILFFFCVLASSTIFYIFVCFHPGFNPLSSICFLYRSSVFSMPLCFSLASPFLFPVLVFSLFLNFLYTTNACTIVVWKYIVRLFELLSRIISKGISKFCLEKN